MKHRTHDRGNTVKHHQGSERGAEILLSDKKGTGWENRKKNGRRGHEERAMARVQEEASAAISKREGVSRLSGEL